MPLSNQPTPVFISIPADMDDKLDRFHPTTLTKCPKPSVPTLSGIEQTFGDDLKGPLGMALPKKTGIVYIAFDSCPSVIEALILPQMGNAQIDITLFK